MPVEFSADSPAGRLLGMDDNPYKSPETKGAALPRDWRFARGIAVVLFGLFVILFGLFSLWGDYLVWGRYSWFSIIVIAVGAGLTTGAAMQLCRR